MTKILVLLFLTISSKLVIGPPTLKKKRLMVAKDYWFYAWRSFSVDQGVDGDDQGSLDQSFSPHE